ncbi:MAG: hypothetical protein JO061_03590 [Acidobacteriaceae bacterium]|nr:hypothetical protein [Acidobacteriaceae bacterium]
MESFILQDRRTFNVLVHYHMMKNAGTTLGAVLRREFNGAYAELHGSDPGSMISSAELAAFIVEHPHIRAISSHHVRFPILKDERFHFAYCCFLRHPLDRLYSLYTFFKKTEDQGAIGQLANRKSPAGFFSKMIEQYPNYVCNVQTSYLACRGFFLHPPDQEDLGVAVRVMQECTLPGVVHRMDESLATAEYFLNPLYPGIRLHYLPENVLRGLTTSLADREYEVKEACGRKVYSQLAAFNRLDMDLVKRTEQELERRMHLVPEFRSRLADFEARCSALRPASAVSSEIEVTAEC